MSGKNPRYFGTLAGKIVLKLIFSFVVWKWAMTSAPMEFFPENGGTKGEMIHSSRIVT